MGDLIVSLLVAVLSGMGVGSGGLLVVWLTAHDGIGQVGAQGLNLLFFLFASAASGVVNYKRGKIRLRAAALLAAGGVPGAILGAVLASVWPPLLLRRLFGAMLLLTGVPALLRSLGAFFSRRAGKNER